MTTHTDNSLEELFKGILNSVGLAKSVTVSTDNKQLCRWSVSLKTTDSVVLTYNPNCVDLGEHDLLLADLRHEACHLLTIPTTKLVYPNVDGAIRSLIHSYMDLFREYLAEVEYKRRFPEDRACLQLREQTFHPEAVIVVFNEQLRNGEIPPESAMCAYFEVLFAIFYDAVGLHVQGSSLFEDWCNTHAQLRGLKDLFKIILEDMELIANAPVNYFDKLHIVHESFANVMNISLDDLMCRQVVTFMMKVPAPTRYPLLTELWRRRVTDYREQRH